MRQRRYFQALFLLVGVGAAALWAGAVRGDGPAPAAAGAAAQAQVEASPSAATDHALLALQGELEALLEPGAAAHAALAPRLRDLAEQARDLAEQADRDGAPAQQMTARHMEAEARYQSIQQLLADQQATTASFQLIQLRRVARAIRAVDDPAAGAVGDYWALLADAITIRREVETPQLALPRLAEVVGIYVAVYSDRPAAAPIVDDLRPMLWRLYDQLGRSDAASALMPAIEASHWAADPAHADQLAGMRQTAALLGEPLALAIQADAGPWSLALHHGRAVLLQVVREVAPVQPALPEAMRIDRVIVTLADPNEPIQEIEADAAAPLNDVAAEVGEVVRLRVTHRDEATRLTAALAITSVPRWVLVDEQGAVFATGTIGAADAVRRLHAARAEAATETQR